MSLLRALTALASPGSERGRLLTFFFLRVLAQPDPLQPGEVDARRFDTILRWIGEQFRVLPPLQACEALAGGNLPARAAILTFDDGYRDNHDVALPILQRQRMKAAFFIATGYLGDGVQFNDRLTELFRELQGDSLDIGWLGLGTLKVGSLHDRLQALDRVREAVKYLDPEARLEAVERLQSACGVSGDALRCGRVMMTPEEVASLAGNGMEIGGHTVTHPILQAVDDATAYEEIVGGRDALNGILGRAPLMFAYPNGKPGADFGSKHAAMASDAGFRFAFSTHRGVATRHTDPMLIPRFMPWHTDELRFKLQAFRLTTRH